MSVLLEPADGPPAGDPMRRAAGAASKLRAREAPARHAILTRHKRLGYRKDRPELRRVRRQHSRPVDLRRIHDARRRYQARSATTAATRAPGSGAVPSRAGRPAHRPGDGNRSRRQQRRQSAKPTRPPALNRTSRSTNGSSRDSGLTDVLPVEHAIAQWRFLARGYLARAASNFYALPCPRRTSSTPVVEVVSRHARPGIAPPLLKRSSGLNPLHSIAVIAACRIHIGRMCVKPGRSRRKHKSSEGYGDCEGYVLHE